MVWFDPIKLQDLLFSLNVIVQSIRPSSRLGELSFRDAVQSLGEREKKILYLRFFQGKTQIEVADEIGISQAQVSRLEKGALRKIKESV